MRKIIDNEPMEYKLDKYNMKSAIQEIIETKNPEFLDIAVGFFNLSGWKLLENHLLRLKQCRLLVGWELRDKKNVEREIQELFAKQLEDISIEDYTDTRSYVKSLIAFLEKKNPNYPLMNEDSKKNFPEQEFANQIKLHTSPHIHGKLYLFPRIGFVGSSNFTAGGLTGNTELNITIEDDEVLTHLRGWFEHFFSSPRSIDYRLILLNQLKNSKFGDVEYPPYWVFLKIIFEYHKYEIRKNIEDEDEVIRLAKFQQEGVMRALDIIEDFGGVMIADAVGLGKSYMGVSILRTLAIRAPPMKNNILVVCPAQLKLEWERNLINAGLTSAAIYTQEMMSRNPIEKKAYDIILVDESHNFRRPKPKRYANFMNVLTRKDPKIILLTATPINISYFDLYYQLKLIFKNKDTALSNSLNIPNLFEFFKGIDKGENDINLITEHLIVARSRAVIRYRQKTLKQDIILPNGKKIEFPDRDLHTIRYKIIKDYELLADFSEKLFTKEYKDAKNELEGKFEESEERSEKEIEIHSNVKLTPSNLFYWWIFKILQSWEGAAFKIENYKKLELQDADKVRSSNSIVPLMTTTLLKRLESSLYAFLKSVLGQIQFCVFAKAAINNGFFISSNIVNEIKNLLANEGDEVELDLEIFENFETLDETFTQELERGDFKQKLKTLEDTLKLSSNSSQKKIQVIEQGEFLGSSLEDLTRAIDKDIELFKGIYAIAKEIITSKDYKIEELKTELERIFKNATDYKERKVVIFTFFETTAQYIYDSLKNDGKFLRDLKNPKIEIISGKISNPKTRRKIIEHFAPVSAEKDIPEEEQSDILISTDVLSEGQNLQDAKHVINYDLHWNPVRMIQRAGRIDRLGSLHKEITIHNFFLEEGLEALLNLMKRIVSRLRKIDDTFELDAPVIEMDKDYRNLNRIEKGDVNVIEEYEEQLELIGLNQSKKDLLSAIQEIGYEKFAKTPLGIHSGLLTLDNSGLMVAIELVKQKTRTPTTIWCYEPDDPLKEFPGLSLPNGILQSKHVIEKIIRCGKSVKRVVVEEPEEIYARAAKIIRNIKDLHRQKTTASTMITRIEAGNKKYYNLLSKGIKLWGLEKKFAERFLEFLKTKKFDNIRRDPAIGDALQIFNDTFNQIDEAAKHMEDDSSLNNWRKEILEDFLINIYKYFDAHEILTEKETEKVSKDIDKVKLIGILRLYTTETLKNLRNTVEQ